MLFGNTYTYVDLLFFIFLKQDIENKHVMS